MTIKIVFKKSDGSCGIIHPAKNCMILMSEEEVKKADLPAGEHYRPMTLEEIAKKDVPSGASWRFVAEENIPNDKSFFDAFTDDNPTETVDIDMQKAREIWMKRIRRERNLKFIDLDFEYMRADELGNLERKAELAQKKQMLRDIPLNFDLTGAKKLEDLKMLWPEM